MISCFSITHLIRGNVREVFLNFGAAYNHDLYN